MLQGIFLKKKRTFFLIVFQSSSNSSNTQDGWFNIGAHFRKGNSKNVGLCKKHDIKFHIVKTQPTPYFPHSTLRAISPYSISVFFPCNKSNTAARFNPTTAFFWWNYKRDAGCMNAPAIWEKVRNICAGLDGIQRKTFIYTQRRLRPLARRAANTARPPFVAMRERNPWVLARLRLFGW